MKTTAQTKIEEESMENTTEIQQSEETELQVNEKAPPPYTLPKNQKIWKKTENPTDPGSTPVKISCFECK